MNAKVSRGERILQKITNEGKISECGKDWLMACLDPFHDHQLKNLKGWPDVQTGASVVRILKQSVTVSAPASAPANWDCHIVQWPWLTANQGVTGVGNWQQIPVRAGQNLSLPAVLGTNQQVGGLQIYGTTPGTLLNILGTAPTTLLATLQVDPQFSQGVTRLIGVGFEVHNTTSQLNVQGACLVYRQMANENTNLSWNLENATSIASFDGPLVKFPPTSTADALLLAGSRQWEAKDGCYSVSAFHSTENPATLIVPTAPVIAASNILDTEGSIAVSSVNAVVPGPPDAQHYAAVPSFRVHNIHQNGAIFSGLSQSTTLTINWNVILETFPSTDDKEILPLAVPSAEFDPEVLDLYSRVITDLPVGVPVSENGLGDWFYDAAVTAAKYIGPVLSMAPHPVLKGIGVAATGIADYAEKHPSTGAGEGNNVAPLNSWGRPPRKNKAFKAAMAADPYNNSAYQPSSSSYNTGNIPIRRKKVGSKSKKPSNTKPKPSKRRVK